MAAARVPTCPEHGTPMESFQIENVTWVCPYCTTGHNAPGPCPTCAAAPAFSKPAAERPAVDPHEQPEAKLVLSDVRSRSRRARSRAPGAVTAVTVERAAHSPLLPRQVYQ